MTMLSVPISGKDHMLGPKAAQVTLVMYGDFECPYSGQAYPIINKLLKKYSRTLRFVYRHFPITEIHAHAEHAAEISEAAALEGKFWEMHHMLFENQDALHDLALMEYAEAIDMNLDNAAKALDFGTHRSRIERDFWSGIHSGVNGTPTFFINGARYEGSYDLNELSMAIEHAMHQRKYA